MDGSMDKGKKEGDGFSVCIPIYNWNVGELVETIHRQSLSSGFDFEILLIDDGSSCYKEENRKLRNLSHVTYIELERNIGRAAIRNMLVFNAEYDILIFLDCDTRVVSDDYISDYLSSKQFPVVVGGYLYAATLMDENCRLRWFYGKHREERNASDRNTYPNKSFSTFNFMIRKEVFRLVKFDENLSGYGHEDTLFGWELKQRGVTVRHIDNPLLHLSLDDSSTYLDKIENSMNNLWLIYQKMTDKKEFCKDIKVLRCYETLRRLRLSFLLAILFPFVKRLLYHNLLSTRPSLFLFDIYKLGVLNEKASKF